MPQISFKTVLIAAVSLWALHALPAEAAQRRVFVAALDESGSYELREKAVGLVAEVIREMEGGDMLYLRRITDRSYDDAAAAIFRLEIPEAAAKPTNPFDPKAKRAYHAAVRQQARYKQQALAVLSQLKPVKAPYTDIWGALQAAADRFATEPGSTDKVLILFSDMKDNCKRTLKEIDLNGVLVIVAGFQNTEDVLATQRLRSRWTKILQGFGAKSVFYLAPDQGLRIVSTPKNTAEAVR